MSDSIEVVRTSSCGGGCKEPGVDREARRHRCHPERYEDTGTVRARVKRLNSEAGQLKLDLHDLAEDLPDGWERIVEVAQRTYDKYAELMTARQALQQLEAGKDG